MPGYRANILSRASGMPLGTYLIDMRAGGRRLWPSTLNIGAHNPGEQAQS